MGEYERLNNMLDEEQARYEDAMESGDTEYAAEILIGIGEIKGALLEMAYLDGLDDPYEAFD